jgi:hypothetical protein
MSASLYQFVSELHNGDNMAKRQQRPEAAAVPIAYVGRLAGLFRPTLARFAGSK